MEKSSILRELSFLPGVLAEAFAGLRDNRLRSVLSIMGMAVGVAAIIAVSAISKAGHEVIFAELNTFGLKSIWIFREASDGDPHRTSRAGTGISEADYDAVRQGCCDKLLRVSPLVYSKKSRLVIRRGNSYSNAQVVGVGVDFLTVNNDVVREGRPFILSDEQRRRRVAIIGPMTKDDLFLPHEDPVGESIRILGQELLVIGVLQEKSRDFLSSIGSTGGQNANNRILVPYSYMQILNGDEQAGRIDGLQGEAVSLAAANGAAGQVKQLLERNNQYRFRYRQETMAQYIGTANRILNGVAIIGVVAASVSLLVGGMGVMNIMSTSVLERTREIGLRRAIGARKSDVLFQFLGEAVVIGFLGGAVGLALGSLASYILALLTGFPLQPTWYVVAVGLIVSIGVGVLSGLAPAVRAANLRPVQALRYE